MSLIPFFVQDLTFFLSYAILAAVLGMLQFGYNTGVINAPEQNIEDFMKDVYKARYGEDLSDDAAKGLYSIAVSIFALGGMLGGFGGGMVANKFGRYEHLFLTAFSLSTSYSVSRKGGLLLNNVLGITGACLMWCTKLANSYEILFFGRFIIGVNCGEYVTSWLNFTCFFVFIKLKCHTSSGDICVCIELVLYKNSCRNKLSTIYFT